MCMVLLFRSQGLIPYSLSSLLLGGDEEPSLQVTPFIPRITARVTRITAERLRGGWESAWEARGSHKRALVPSCRLVWGSTGSSRLVLGASDGRALCSENSAFMGMTHLHSEVSLPFPDQLLAFTLSLLGAFYLPQELSWNSLRPFLCLASVAIMSQLLHTELASLL
jgi:hypothetical protein